MKSKDLSRLGLAVLVSLASSLTWADRARTPQVQTPPLRIEDLSIIDRMAEFQVSDILSQLRRHNINTHQVTYEERLPVGDKLVLFGAPFEVGGDTVVVRYVLPRPRYSYADLSSEQREYMAELIRKCIARLDTLGARAVIYNTTLDFALSQAQRSKHAFAENSSIDWAKISLFAPPEAIRNVLTYLKMFSSDLLGHGHAELHFLLRFHPSLANRYLFSDSAQEFLRTVIQGPWFDTPGNAEVDFSTRQMVGITLLSVWTYVDLKRFPVSSSLTTPTQHMVDTYKALANLRLLVKFLLRSIISPEVRRETRLGFFPYYRLLDIAEGPNQPTLADVLERLKNDLDRAASVGLFDFSDAMNTPGMEQLRRIALPAFSEDLAEIGQRLRANKWVTDRVDIHLTPKDMPKSSSRFCEVFEQG